jgi:hypothetical protein
MEEIGVQHGANMNQIEIIEELDLCTKVDWWEQRG